MVIEELRFLGVDWGEKRIGLALGDSVTKIATPFKVVGSINDVVKIIEKEEINEVIVGLPLKMDFGKSHISEQLQDEFLKFLDLLIRKSPVPIKTVDERLSSKAADSLVGDKKTKAKRDAIAAMLILQTYLDILYLK